MLFNDALNTFYLRIYGVGHYGKELSDSERSHMGYSFQLAARVLLYAPPHRLDSTYQGLCYTSHGALAGTSNSSIGPPWRINPTTHRTILHLLMLVVVFLLFCLKYTTNDNHEIFIFTQYAYVNYMQWLQCMHVGFPLVMSQARAAKSCSFLLISSWLLFYLLLKMGTALLVILFLTYIFRTYHSVTIIIKTAPLYPLIVIIVIYILYGTISVCQ